MAFSFGGDEGHILGCEAWVFLTLSPLSLFAGDEGHILGCEAWVFLTLSWQYEKS
jgi:hypothetical protein